MASINQVTIELRVSGEREARKALNAFAEANKRVGSSVGEVARKVSSIEGEWKSLGAAQQRGAVSANELRSANTALARQLATLTGMTEAEARAALSSATAAQRKAEADRRAAQSAEEHARAQRNLEGSVLRQSQAVNQAVSRMEELQRLQTSGAVGSRNMAQAKLEIARALARTNGYLTANGALNTQKALAEIRAAQATQQAAAAEAAKTAATQRATQSYNQLMASLNPTIAAQQRLSQGVQTLRAAQRAGVITAGEAIASLRQLRAAHEALSIAQNRSTRGVNRSGLIMQQTGYQVGDFIVQVQGGTNAFVAFGQQATQVAGTLTLLGGKWILIGSVLGITIPLFTALGAAMMRTNVQIDSIYEKFGFLEGAVRGLASAFGEVGSVILNVLSTIVQNLDVFVTILGVAAVAAVVKFVAATRTMGTIMTSIGLIFTTTGGAALVATSAVTALRVAMTRLMVIISAHPIIAAMTAALAAAVIVLYRARDASGGFRSNVEGLSDALRELRENAREAGIEAARIQLGVDTSAQAVARQRVLEIDREIVRLQAQINQADPESVAYHRDILDALIAEREEIERLIKLDQERIDAMKAAETQSNLDAIIGSYDEQHALQVRINSAQEQLNEAVRLQLINQDEAVRIMNEYIASQDGTAERLAAQLDLEKRISQQITERNQRVAGRRQDLENEIRVMRITLRYGEDSVEVQTELNRQAQARLVTEMMLEGATGEQISQMLALVREAQELEGALRDAANSADDTADASSRIGPALNSAVAQANAFANAMARARSESAGIGISTAGIEAEIAALEGGSSIAEARAEGAAVTLREQLFEEFPTLERDPRDAAVQDVERQVEVRRQVVLQRELAQQRLGDVHSRTGSGSGSGGGRTGAGAADDAFQSRIAGIRELQSAIEEAQRQTALFEQEVSLLDSALENGLITQQRYNELLREAQDAYGQAATGAYDYQSALEQVSKKAQSAMEDAFMSIIDGSASASDAFRDMARQILAEAIRMLVIRPMIDSLFGGLGGGWGFLGGLSGGSSGHAAVHGGNVIPLANGGVVNSPTMFPMRGNQTGLMGEAGPEAIMPLNRGRDGKLGVVAEGGAGNVTINQSFNFSANGDESVKRIIASEAPKIAALTQKQIVDQRRRGGQMRNAFG